MAKREAKKRIKTAGSKTVSKSQRTKVPRLRSASKKQAKQRAKKEVRSRPPIIGSFKLTGQVFNFLKHNSKPLAKIVLVYALLNLVFGNGIIGNAASIISTKHSSKFSDALSSFGSIISSGGGSNQTVTMQTVLLIIESLVIIWAIRHLFAAEKIGLKQAYYLSTTPLIPFLIVIFFIILQLLPLTVGAILLTLVLSVTSGSSLVGIIAAAIFVILAAWSIYMVCSSVFALYIVTLPGMEPRAAMHSARSLAHYRRWPILRRLLFLPLSMLIFMGIIIIPLILWAHFLAAAAFFVLSMLAVLYAHTYLYSLYKGLLV